MAERELPKLEARVRFPSPAPKIIAPRRRAFIIYRIIIWQILVKNIHADIGYIARIMPLKFR